MRDQFAAGTSAGLAFLNLDTGLPKFVLDQLGSEVRENGDQALDQEGLRHQQGFVAVEAVIRAHGKAGWAESRPAASPSP